MCQQSFLLLQLCSCLCIIVHLSILLTLPLLSHASRTCRIDHHCLAIDGNRSGFASECVCAVEGAGTARGRGGGGSATQSQLTLPAEPLALHDWCSESLSTQNMKILHQTNRACTSTHRTRALHTHQHTHTARQQGCAQLCTHALPHSPAPRQHCHALVGSRLAWTTSDDTKTRTCG